MDLVLHFRCGDTSIKAGDTQIILRGRLLSGEPFVGVYPITVISK